MKIGKKCLLSMTYWGHCKDRLCKNINWKSENFVFRSHVQLTNM